MRKTVVWSTIVGIIATIVVIAVALNLMANNTSGSAQDGTQADTAASSSETDEPAAGDSADRLAALEGTRPACPPGAVGGIELPCLGAQPAKATSNSDYTVVNMWAWWCGPCRQELPAMQAFANANPQYQVVGVHADVNPERGVDLLKELNVDLPSYQDDDNTFAGTLGLPGVIPITLVFDGDTRIATFPTPFESAEDIQKAVDKAVADYQKNGA